jgi:hypothetical protein
MRAIVGILIAAALAFASGCARTDWIDRTLVTVDVTGTWSGGAQGMSASPSPGDVVLELNQEGPTVKGSVRSITALAGGSTMGPIVGTVTGDVFRFKQTNGSLEGELTVNGDEMTGQITRPLTGARMFSLRRVEPSSRPASPPR